MIDYLRGGVHTQITRPTLRTGPISPWIDIRTKLDIVRDDLAERAAVMGNVSQASSSNRIGSNHPKYWRGSMAAAVGSVAGPVAAATARFGSIRQVWISVFQTSTHSLSRTSGRNFSVAQRTKGQSRHDLAETSGNTSDPISSRTKNALKPSA
jgi:hypothetical protein